MTVITKPKPKTEKCMTECVNDSLLVHTDLPGISLQYKLVATTDPSLPLDEAEHLGTVYSVLIIKSDRDPVETVDETVFVYDVSRSCEAAHRLLSALAGGCVSPLNAREVIYDFICGE